MMKMPHVLHATSPCALSSVVKWVDIVAEVPGRLVPFKVKYSHQHTGAGDLKGLVTFCTEKQIARGYAITRNLEDFSVLPLDDTPAKTRIVKIPAPLACYWLGQSELQSTRQIPT